MERTAELRLTALFFVGVAALAWVITANRMEGMDMGPGTDLGGLGWFAGVWAVMMAAMMLPSLVPMAAAYAAGARVSSQPATPQSVAGRPLFGGGYLLAWVLAGLVAWTIVEGIRGLDLAFLAWDDTGRYVAGAVIAGAALYELTPAKASCLRHCRDRELLIADWRDGPAAAFRMGLGQGAYCIGSSWALMAALFALGVMSITWMVVIAAAVALDKLLPWRAPATRATALFLLVLAAGVAFFPGELPGLTMPMSM